MRPPTRVITPCGVGRHRNKTKIIAYADNILSTLMLTVVSVYAYRMAIIRDDPNVDPDRADLLHAISIVAIVSVFCYFINAWLAWSLIFATDETLLPALSIRKAQYWIYYSVFLTLFELFSAILSTFGDQYVGTAGFLFFIPRLVAAYIVRQFISEQRLIVVRDRSKSKSAISMTAI